MKGLTKKAAGVESGGSAEAPGGGQTEGGQEGSGKRGVDRKAFRAGYGFPFPQITYAARHSLCKRSTTRAKESPYRCSKARLPTRW